MKRSDVKWWIGLVVCVVGALYGQAELMGEPWRHYLSIASIMCTAINAYMIKGE